MFKKLFVSLALSVSLMGCSALGVQPIHKDIPEVTKQDPVKAAQFALDELNATISALATAIIHDYHEGVWTREEVAEFYYALNNVVLKSNEAENFIDLGNILKANDRLGVAQAALTALQSRLIDLKNKERN